MKISLLENGGSVEYGKGYILLKDSDDYTVSIFKSIDDIDKCNHIDCYCYRIYEDIDIVCIVTYKELRDIINNAKELSVFNVSS